jgi:hypothetical protein
VKRISILFVLIHLANFCPAQISYRTRFKTAVVGEVFATSPVVSLNVEHALNRQMKSFVILRYGLGFVPGARKPTGLGWQDNGVSVPVSISQNFLINNLKKRLKYRVSLRCKSMPSKISIEWFGEAGVGYTPLFYSISEPRHSFAGIVGLRQQMVIDIPPKPKVIFLKVLYTPKYYRGDFSWNPITGNTNIFGMSLGVSI